MRNPTRATAVMTYAAVAFFGACQRTQVTPPVSLDDLRVVPTPIGVDVSFVLRDAQHKPTVMMFGAGAIRIEDAPTDSGEIVADGPLDSTRLLYNRRIIISREYFARERIGTGRDEMETEVCRLGIFPYRQFIRPPRRRYGVVHVAVVSTDGKHVMHASRRFPWPDAAFAPQTEK